jgi:hypothetical protein
MLAMKLLATVAMLASAHCAVFAHEGGVKENWQSHPKLYDANNRFVGVVVDAPGGDVSDGGVVMNIDGAPVFVGVALEKAPDETQSASKLLWSGVRPSYSGTNCSGTPYIPYTLGPLRPAAIERKGAKAILLVAKDAPSQYVSVGSQDYGTDCGNFVEQGGAPAWVVSDSIDLTARFPEPLHLGR